MKIKQRLKHEWRFCSGQIMVEACIGLALMVFTWILFSYSTYMANNHIKTVMASRHAAWLQSHGVNPTAGVSRDFFNENDGGYVTVLTKNIYLPISESMTKKSGIDDKLNWAEKGNACYATVSFGMSAEKLKTTEAYPFVLMKTKVPFMTSSMLDNFLSVESHCAWPADANDTWTEKSKALRGVKDLILSEMSDITRKVWKLISGLFS